MDRKKIEAIAIKKFYEEGCEFHPEDYELPEDPVIQPELTRQIVDGTVWRKMNGYWYAGCAVAFIIPPEASFKKSWYG